LELKTIERPALKPQRPRIGSNGEANKLDAADSAGHGWYRFILSFPPHLVREYVNRLGIDSHQKVLDPFCGTATTVVECKKLGIASMGVEAHPMPHFAGQVKTDWTINPDELLNHATQIADAVQHELASQGINDDVDSSDRLNDIDLLTLPAESMRLLLTDSMSPMPMHKTLVLLKHLQERSGSQFHRHELLALAKSLVSKIGNLHFGPEVGISPAKPDVAVVSTWLENVTVMAEDLRQLGSSMHTPAAVYRADSRQLMKAVPADSIDAIITSPPYPNEKDYTRTTRLESVLLGLVRDRAEMKQLKQSLMRSNTRNVYKGDDDDVWVADHAEIQRIAKEIEDRRIAMKKTSGFERLYAKVTKLYFGGMARHFDELKAVLRPGARLAYVVGDQASYLQVMIRTGQILADIAERQGYEVIGIDLFRTRLATATNQQLREEVVLLRWPGTSSTIH
jgi:DNA modification methylase